MLPAPATGTEQNILEIESLNLAYRNGTRRIQAASGVSLSVGATEAVGIVGESGSGKSTIARAVLGLLPEKTSEIESGHILIAGDDVTRITPTQWEDLRGNPVAIVFQDPLSFLNPVARIATQIGESVRRHDPDCDEAVRVAELLSLVKLPPASGRAYPHELSGGMRQRALLAVALGCRPRLLVADEPTTALDITTQTEILDLLRELRDRLGMALLVISHDLSVISAACDRIYVMYAGRMVEWGETRTILTRPAHPYTAALLRAAMAQKDARGRFLTIGGDVFDLSRPSSGCPFAPRCTNTIARCLSEMPAATDCAGDTGHMVRCWSPVGAGPEAAAHG